MDKSNITNPEYFKHIQVMVENVRKSRVMVTKDVGEA